MADLIQRNIIDVLIDLPEKCMLRDSIDPKKVIGVKRGVTGYWHMPGRSVDWARGYNERKSITPAQVEAMRIGSYFGFDVPGADPLNCLYATDMV